MNRPYACVCMCARPTHEGIRLHNKKRKDKIPEPINKHISSETSFFTKPKSDTFINFIRFNNERFD